MFLMWAQQWRYICRAMELGYRVLRADTDVYFAEDPYPILNGPLFGRYEMVVRWARSGRSSWSRLGSTPCAPISPSSSSTGTP